MKRSSAARFARGFLYGVVGATLGGACVLLIAHLAGFTLPAVSTMVLVVVVIGVAAGIRRVQTGRRVSQTTGNGHR